ncbi:dephospho-CoA kinase [Mycoplasmopsis pullorum]|uniref:Dephospho-CoA kinase n=1 Tax=Mycoplasmopsis pullorum TaxID=48003 RepID=A0A1L4FRG7_9BACT|nr:dephospho-CoA kinase [Mycoplasmopsis pullorum]APJ38196.1 hypothetical protein BLA55_00635 [Mycoplasmopsis pullorum]
MIAVVGKVASGKSTFLKHLQELGFKIFICDDYVNWLYCNDEQVKLNFINFFGQDVVQNGQINKSFLKEQIKLNPQNLKFIEKVIFPIIFEHLKTHLYDFVEIPVLFTDIVDFSKLFSAIWNLTIDEENHQKFLDSRNVDNFLKSQFIEKKAYFFDEISTFRGIKVVNISLDKRRTSESIKEFLSNQKIYI